MLLMVIVFSDRKMRLKPASRIMLGGTYTDDYFFVSMFCDVCFV